MNIYVWGTGRALGNLLDFHLPVSIRGPLLFAPGLFWRGGPVRALLCDMLFKKALQHCMANALRAEVNGFSGRLFS